ncbi:hypothetical protein [Streptomyces mirabilis]|uniref:hypothetical protein n=1 Tax=Streptomyces mirabilis TaxID=68239 RepID=UPI00368D4E6C
MSTGSSSTTAPPRSPTSGTRPRTTGTRPRPPPRDSFSHASGLDLFSAAYDRLTALGIRTPCLLFADRSHTRLPSDVAVVEDVRGGSLEDLLHAHPAPRHGKVAVVDNGGSA